MEKRIKFLMLIVVTLLAGCSQGNDSADLQHYIAALKKQPSKAPDILKDYKLRKPSSYQEDPNRSAFPQQATIGNPADANKAPLERYPIDALNLLGTIDNYGKSVAVISTPDGKVYQATIGDKIGNLQGKITKITEYQVTIDEPASVATGNLAARTVTLRLKDQ